MWGLSRRTSLRRPYTWRSEKRLRHLPDRWQGDAEPLGNGHVSQAFSTCQDDLGLQEETVRYRCRAGGSLQLFLVLVAEGLPCKLATTCHGRLLCARD